MKNPETPSTADQLAAVTKRLATELGRLPTLEELRSNTSSPRGGMLSNGSLYHAFAPFGDGGLSDFAKAQGVFQAVIVDGIVYSGAYEGDPRALEQSSLQHATPREAPAQRIGQMPMDEIIGLLGKLAAEIERRGSRLTTQAQQIIRPGQQ